MTRTSKPAPFAASCRPAALGLLLAVLLSLAVATPASALAADAFGADAPMSPDDTEAEIGRLRAALMREVPGAFIPGPTAQAEWVRMAQAMIARSNFLLDRPQLIVVVDRNPRVQALCLVMIQPDGPWQAIGGTHVSTGQPGRFDHYITPLGVFPHTALILDFRAEGTFNENHIRGLGLKGMRVWDFGWQWATKGWRADGERGQMRLLMHATDPTYLEQRIGRQASSGCVRIPAALNRFLDRHGVLDAEYEAAARDDLRYRALLPRDRTPTPLAGTALVVVNSSQPTTPDLVSDNRGLILVTR